MKLAKLKNGKILSFPDNTSDDVVQATVKRMLGIKDDDSEVEDDSETESVVDTTPVLLEQNNLLKDFFDFFKKNKKDDCDAMMECATELAKRVIDVSINLELLVSKMDENTSRLIESQAENTKALYQLVKAYKSPKTIIRDDDGKPQRIE